MGVPNLGRLADDEGAPYVGQKSPFDGFTATLRGKMRSFDWE